MKEVKIGFIGCGGNANGHMNQLSGIEGARIVAVCDVQTERAQNAAEKHNAEPYTVHQEMLERDDLDAVYLSLPVFVHGQPELDVIARAVYRSSLRSLSLLISISPVKLKQQWQKQD